MSREIFVISKRILMLEEREAWFNLRIGERMFKEVDKHVSVIIKNTAARLVEELLRSKDPKDPTEPFNGIVIPSWPVTANGFNSLETRLKQIDSSIPIGFTIDGFSRCHQKDPEWFLHVPFRIEEIRSFLNKCPRSRE